jgi:dynein heavy chain 1
MDLIPPTNGHSDLANGEASTSSTAPSAATSFDPELFRNYLLALLPPVIGASPDDLESLFDDEFDARVTRFASEAGAVLYVVKSKEELEGAYLDLCLGKGLLTTRVSWIDDSPPIYSYHLTSQLTYHSSNVTTLALIKRGPILDPLTPLATQLHFLNLFAGDETPYESLHALVSHGVKPWFDAFVGSRGGAKEGDTKLGIPMTKKKFAELELSLLHLQQNVEIPETHLIIHNVIQRAVQEAQENGVRPNISHLPPHLLSDSSFLNTLHSHVNSWIKSIQAVTKLSRDVSSGTASQEINFWLSLERALENIEAQLRTDEVNMVMDCLRNAKRFHATVSFIADTGLKDATDLVHKYNQLMKDFPLNELLSATDLDKVQEGLNLIFGHVNRKLKLSPYPIRRALPLVEAISRDFNDVLLHILTSHRLLYTPYDTFERLMNQTANIFKTWDDHIKEFTSMARELTRKRVEKFIPIKIAPAHAKLQNRTQYLREWRKQHEQLAVMTGPTRGLGVGAIAGAGVAMDIGGVDMEEEVKEAYEIMKRIDVLEVSVGELCTTSWLLRG